ncbi:MAG: cell division protein ZapA [Cytophagales bacterium]|nr:cell division protein ZapA [Cytophagales bacterium]
MEELSVKIRICDREYPMKVCIEEEACIRAAGKLINDKVKTYKEKFGIDDKQDLLAMVAFDCLVDTLKSNDTESREEKIIEQVNNLTQLVAQVLEPH